MTNEFHRPIDRRLRNRAIQYTERSSCRVRNPSVLRGHSIPWSAATSRKIPLRATFAIIEDASDNTAVADGLVPLLCACAMRNSAFPSVERPLFALRTVGELTHTVLAVTIGANFELVTGLRAMVRRRIGHRVIRKTHAALGVCVRTGSVRCAVMSPHGGWTLGADYGFLGRRLERRCLTLPEFSPRVAGLRQVDDRSPT